MTDKTLDEGGADVREPLHPNFVPGWGRIDQCPACKACSLEEAETRCKPEQDITGEYGCPGVDWPLEQLWEGALTVEQVKAKLAEEDAYIDSQWGR